MKWLWPFRGAPRKHFGAFLRHPWSHRGSSSSQGRVDRARLFQRPYEIVLQRHGASFGADKRLRAVSGRIEGTVPRQVFRIRGPLRVRSSSAGLKLHTKAWQEIPQNLGPCPLIARRVGVWNETLRLLYRQNVGQLCSALQEPSRDVFFSPVSSRLRSPLGCRGGALAHTHCHRTRAPLAGPTLGPRLPLALRLGRALPSLLRQGRPPGATSRAHKLLGNIAVAPHGSPR